MAFRTALGSVGRLTRDVRDTWRAVRRSRTTEPDTTDAGPASGTAAAPAEPAEAEAPESIRARILQDYRDRLVELHGKHGSAPDVNTLLRELAAFEPGSIRQPMGAAQRVLDLLRNDNYSGAQIASVIETDPAIAQSLLRHANADWYDEEEGVPLASLIAAARRVGAQGVHASVMAVILEGGCIRPGAGLDRVAAMTWDHMVRVAPMCRQLAHGFGGDADTAFTLGLCHDVGKLILFEKVAELRRGLRREISFPRGFLGEALALLHESLGGLACLGWGMPEDFALRVATHHRSPVPEAADPLSEALFLVEKLDLAMQNGTPFDLEGLWRVGGITAPIERGRPLVEQTNRTAVEVALAKGTLRPDAEG